MTLAMPDSANALVVGDVMLDRYLDGSVHRISPEAPVPVVALTREWTRSGGAGNVAASLAGLGCRVTILGLTGDDREAELLRHSLAQASVDPSEILSHRTLRTITKTRVVSQGQHQLIRLDQDGDRAAFEEASRLLEARAIEMVSRHDVVVLSDYGKGVLSTALLRHVIESARRRGIPCLVDPKRTDFRAYAGATLLTPNLQEASRSVGQPLEGDADIGKACLRLREELALDHMLITRGAEGMSLATGSGVEHFPAEVREVADVTGAGDTVVAVLAARLGVGQSIQESCRAASVGAGIAVSHAGCYVVKQDELDRALQGISPKIRMPEDARAWASEQRRGHKKIVFTNGCFDILHAGHLYSLEQARKMGDLLVVGLNSDNSVRANKGPTRPVVDQKHRARLLAGLACVDLVVVFDEPTPERLIRMVGPDVLVKGGDYTLDQVVGAEFVLGRGGKVTTIPLVPGLSTTQILRGTAEKAASESDHTQAVRRDSGESSPPLRGTHRPPGLIADSVHARNPNAPSS
jgi:D-beta-D-heptose 7-phosphate kinase/D-beta-D-heptose 1-phosphate adenosyltransferase